jgi:TolA-binding protein
MKDILLILTTFAAISIVVTITSKANQEQAEFYQTRYNETVDKVNVLNKDIYNLTTRITTLENQLSLAEENIVNLNIKVDNNQKLILKQDSIIAADNRKIENFIFTTKTFLRKAYGN